MGLVGFFDVVEWGPGCFSLRFLIGSLGSRFFGEGFSRVPSGEGLLGFLGLGFSGLLVGEFFLVFALCFLGLALDGGLLGVSFLL